MPSLPRSLDANSTDISYTKAPNWVKLIPDYPHDMCSSFWSLARLSFPEERAKNIGNPLPSPLNNATLDPDEHMLYFDYLYYACAQQVSLVHIATDIPTFTDARHCSPRISTTTIRRRGAM